MDDKQKTKGEEPGTAVEGSDGGVQPESSTLIEDANLAAKRVEEATKALKVQNDRREELMSQAILSGTAEAGGQPEPKETDDEKWAREAKVRYAGTGMDPTE